MELSLEVPLNLQHLEARVKEVAKPGELLRSDFLDRSFTPGTDCNTGVAEGLSLRELFAEEKKRMSEREVLLLLLPLQHDPLLQRGNPPLNARDERPGTIQPAEQRSDLTNVVPALFKLSLFTSDQDRLEVADKLLTVGQLELDLEQFETEQLLLLSEDLPDHDDQLVGIGHVRGDQVGEGEDLTRLSGVRLQRSFTGGGGDEEMLQVSINSPTGEQALQSRNPRALFTSLAPFDSSSTYGFVQTRD